MIRLNTLKKEVLKYFDDDAEWELLNPANQLHRIVFHELIIIIGIEDNKNKLVIADDDDSYHMFIENKHDIRALILQYITDKSNFLDL